MWKKLREDLKFKIWETTQIYSKLSQAHLHKISIFWTWIIFILYVTSHWHSLATLIETLVSLHLSSLPIIRQQHSALYHAHTSSVFQLMFTTNIRRGKNHLVFSQSGLVDSGLSADSDFLLTGVKPDAVFCCSPSTSRYVYCDAFHHDCKKNGNWLVRVLPSYSC